MIKNVVLNGKTISNPQEVSVEIDTPFDRRGIYREPTFAATVRITRDATDNAIVDLFDIATNEDGRKNIISGQLDFHGDDVKDEYSFILKRMFVSNWTLNNPTAPNMPTTETIELKVGSLEYKAGGGGASFDLETFK